MVEIEKSFCIEWYDQYDKEIVDKIRDDVSDDEISDDDEDFKFSYF